ncbi:MAG TPA: hypothetical protein VNO70_14510, partial [Blastocatellia bacterium]|nr:hypothetical protein [Blastocatellia bacterium]
MRKNSGAVWMLVFFLAIGLMALYPVRASLSAPQEGKAEEKEKKDKKDKKGEEDKEKDDINSGKPILWQEPTDIESRDLFYGSGGREGAPEQASKFTFVRRSSGGTSEKIVVNDDKGRSWTVKFGPEARPETAASRLVWAAGYHVDDVYFVREAHIEGRGGFDVYDVRFERRDDGFKDLGPWQWDANRFAGTRELQGLKTLMALLNNWDIKDENNKVVRPNKESGRDRSLRIYYVSDLGGTLGSTGNSLRKVFFFGDLPAGSKGDAEAYANQAFIDGVRDGKVIF